MKHRVKVAFFIVTIANFFMQLL